VSLRRAKRSRIAESFGAGELPPRLAFIEQRGDLVGVELLGRTRFLGLVFFQFFGDLIGLELGLLLRLLLRLVFFQVLGDLIGFWSLIPGLLDPFGGL